MSAPSVITCLNCKGKGYIVYAEERLELTWIERDERDDAREHRETLDFWQDDDGLSHFERVSVETDAWSR